MADSTLISWADKTHNHWEGCQKVGPGCDFCYAEARNKRFSPKGSTQAQNWGPGAPRRLTSRSNRRRPLRWEREAKRDGTRPFVFCSSLADVFDNAVDPAWREELFGLIRATPHLVWLLLTKRPGNIIKMAEAAGGLPPNAAIGCTVVTQAEANRDIPTLLRAAGILHPAFTFLSLEPLLERIDLRQAHLSITGERLGRVKWVIVGGESGPHARPMDEEWAWDVKLQIDSANARTPADPVIFHFKQHGGRKADKGGHMLRGQVYRDRPAPPPLARAA